MCSVQGEGCSVMVQCEGCNVKGAMWRVQCYLAVALLVHRQGESGDITVDRRSTEILWGVFCPTQVPCYFPPVITEVVPQQAGKLLGEQTGKHYSAPLDEDKTISENQVFYDVFFNIKQNKIIVRLRLDGEALLVAEPTPVAVGWKASYVSRAVPWSWAVGSEQYLGHDP